MDIKKTVTRSLFALLLVGLMGGGAGMAQEKKKDQERVKAAVAQFYAALNAMFTGDLTPMKAVWSHADDVTYMGPGGGFRIGWQQILVDWENQAAMNLGGEVEPEQVHITVGQELAVVHNLEKGENVDAEGKPVTVSIRATNLFRKEKGEWKMIGHHVDLLPFIEE